MKSVIGLFSNEVSVDPAVEKLKEIGVAEDRIKTISNPNTVSKMLGCDPTCMIRNYTVLGAAIGIGVYAIFGLVAAMCECTVMHYGELYGFGVFLGSLLAGTIVGGVIGVLVGAAEADKDTHLYVQGIRLGGKMISVQVNDEDAERVKQILTIENVRGLKTI